MTERAFGLEVLDLPAVGVLDAERRTGRDGRFAHQEALLARMLAQACSGERVVTVSYGKRGDGDVVELLGLDAPEEAFLRDHYELARQEARGAWFLPQDASLKVGLTNFGWHMKSQPRFAMNAVRDEVAKSDLRANHHALAVWALIGPFFSDLLAPVDLRAATGKAPTAVQEAKAWAQIDGRYAEIGLTVDDAVAVFRPGGGWHRLRLADQVAARERLLLTIAEQASVETVRRWRAHTVQQLTAAYYKKAKGGTGALARSVLTKGLHPYLAGFFGGDWLAFLDYIGEKAAAGEVIATALPETKLFVGAAPSRVAAVAAEHGLPADEVGRILGTFLGQYAGSSPVEERVAVMRRWWEAYDAAHAAQRPGMRSLWGLVDEGIIVFGNERASEAGLYRSVLPQDVVAEVDRLWDGVTLAQWPERIVSEFYPHRQMARAFGPAIEFWDGLALTCWFICEGPFSRTTLGALGQYHHRQVKALEEAGFPVDRGVFRDLEKAERRLGPVQELSDEETSSESGFTVTFSMSRGSRRDGFEILRDIVTRHRRAWTEAHLEHYLRHRWDSELRAVAQEYHRRRTARGKPPTFKQFASLATDAANHWFNGDLGAVFASFGERAPAATERVDLLAGDPLAFVQAVYRALGGTDPLPQEASWRDRDNYNRNWQAGRLASEATRYLQLQEALGRPPEPKEFGADKLNWEDLGGLDSAWPLYVDAIAGARQVTTRPPASVPVSLPQAEPTAPNVTGPRRSVAVPSAPSANADPAAKRRGLLNRLRGR